MEALTWLAELAAHEFKATDALYLRSDGTPVFYAGRLKNGIINVYEADGRRVWNVTQKELMIRLGEKRTLPAGWLEPAPRPQAPVAAANTAPAPSAPAPKALLAASSPSVPAPRAPSAATPPRAPAAAAAPNHVAQRVAAITAARELSIQILRLQAEHAEAGRVLTASAALAILKSRGKVPPAPSSH